MSSGDPTEHLTSAPRPGTAAAAQPKRTNASRVFGYDVFISFALGPAPRGTHSYASDLARRLRERDFTVFFSEDETAPGDQLDDVLRRALHRSRTLVVIANRETLKDPRWVRTEAEEFTRRRPRHPVVVINIGGALQDPALSGAQRWLGDQNKIWVDESDENALTGIASGSVVERLATAPRRARASVRWRWVVRSVGVTLLTLAVAAGWAALVATRQSRVAEAQSRRAEENRARAEDQRRNAEARLGDAVDLAKTIVGAVDQKLLQVAGAEPVRLELLHATSNLLDRLQAGAENNAVLRARMEGHGQQGNLAESRDLSAAAREYEQYARLAERLQIAQGGAESGRDVAGAYRNLGNVQLQQGHAGRARQSLDKAVSLGQRLVSQSSAPSQFTYDLAQSYRGLGDVARLQEDLAAARDAYLRLVKLSEELERTDASSVPYRWQSALAYTSLADLEIEAGKPAAAKAPLEHSRRILESLRARPGSDQRIDFALATAYCKSADAAKATGSDAEAQRWYERCLERTAALRNADTGNAQYRQALAAGYLGHGDLLARIGEPGRARDAFLSAIALLDEVIAGDPSNAVCRWQLAGVHHRLAVFAQQLGNWKEARAELENSLRLKKQLVDADPDNTRWQRDLLKTYADILRLSEHRQAGIQVQEHLQAANTILAHLRSDPFSARHPAVRETAALLQQLRDRERYVPVPLFDFLGKRVIVNTPVFLMLPSNYVMGPVGTGDAMDGVIWGVKEDVNVVRTTGDFSRIKHGVFHARLSMNVGYADGRFSAEDELQAQLAEAKATNVNVMKETIASYPTLTVVADISGKRVSMFYLALGIDSNTMLVNYRHPPVRTPLDDDVWREFRNGFAMDVVNRWDRGYSASDIVVNALARMAVVPSYVSQLTLRTVLGPNTSEKRPVVRQSSVLTVRDGKLAELRTEVDSSNELVRRTKNEVRHNTYSAGVFDQGKTAYTVDSSGRVFASKGGAEVRSEVHEPFAAAGTNELLALLGYPLVARTPLHEFLSKQLSFYDLRFTGESEGRLLLEGKIKLTKAQPVLKNIQFPDDVARIALNRIAALKVWISKKDYRFERMEVSGEQDNLPFRTQLHVLGIEPQ